MNIRSAAFPVLFLCAAASQAQNVIQDPQEDPVQAAIREFNRRDSGEPNEITVVLPPPAPEKTPDSPKNSADESSPVLVTGKAPEGTQLVEEPADPSPASEPLPEETESKAREGLEVRVEKIQTGKGAIDPSKVKLLAPFPAKPLARPPSGWHLESSESAPLSPARSNWPPANESHSPSAPT